MITDLHTFGFGKETALKTRIEEVLGSEVTKAQERYAKFDYQSDEYYIELKSRRATDRRGRPLLPDSNDTWLLPTCKKPTDDKKETIYFYFFEADNSLWYLVYDEELFATFHTDSPGWHQTGQPHYYIPKDVWTKVEL